MAVRRAELRDMPAIGRLLDEVELVHHRGRPDLFKNGGRKYSDGELSKILGDDRRPVFVYDDGTEGVLGYAFCIFEDHAGDNILEPILTLYIDDICVFERFRGRGIGREIFGFVREFAKSSGCYNITLNAWACNPGAVAFYRKLGFEPYKFGMEKII